MKPIEWEHGPNAIAPARWTCSWCGVYTAATVGLSGFRAPDWGGSGREPHVVVFCASCGCPTHIIEPGSSSQRQRPRAPFGTSVSGVPEQEVVQIFDEARLCVAQGAFTAAVLACRKLLMHVAVSLGAPEGKNFADYVQYLQANQHVTPASAGWVEAIRNRGNEQNHEIRVASQEEATDIVEFCAMLLQTVYEYPSRAKQHAEKLSPKKK